MVRKDVRRGDENQWATRQDAGIGGSQTHGRKDAFAAEQRQRKRQRTSDMMKR
mgnify:CR=1 FL=1